MPKKNKNQKRNKSQRISEDSRIWRMPLDPPETSLSDLKFTIQANPATFQMTKANGFVMTYFDISTVIRSRLGFALTDRFSVRIFSVGAYGSVSNTPAAINTASTQAQIWLQDSFTGRMVAGYSSPVKRARAGFHLAKLRREYWYNASNPPASAPGVDASNFNICTLRIGEGPSCPADDAYSTAVDIVVSGVCRPTRTFPDC